MKKIVCIVLLGICTLSTQAQKVDKHGNLLSMDSVDIYSMVQPIPKKNMFSDSVYNIWCGSVIKGNNGKFYMLYSRWPRTGGHFAWIPNSEIALAKADKPEGPYHHVKVVLAARGSQYWDGVCTHNPAAIVYKGKFYLFYMGTTGKSKVVMPASMKDANWWEYRNNQRIGVAVADDPEGEWKRFDKPILDVSKDSTALDALMVSNPAITVDQNGRAILVYKEVSKGKTFKGGKVHFGVAFSKSLLGPFEKYSQPIFEGKAKGGDSAWMLAEDPYLWNCKGTNYAIVRDVIGYFTEKQSALALLSSKDGIHWESSKYPKVIPVRLKFQDGTLSDDKLERPCLYTEKGVPKLLFGALGFEKRKYSVNVAIPLKFTTE